MFDRLIASEAAADDVKNRRKYFMVSSVVVGLLFTTAVVISIFAADFGLGSTSFELTEMIAPVDMAAPEPEPEQPRAPAAANQSQSQVAMRQVNMASVNEPTIVPHTVSTTQNTHIARPDTGRFVIGDRNTDPVGPGTSGRDATSGPGTGGGLAVNRVETEEAKDPPPPPPIKKVDPAKKPPIQSLGVINGKATHLPKPIYSAAAVSVRAQGKVDVQVMIDETGRVVSASAVSGHPLLRASAEQAARNARFSPTFLSNVAVKVTGVISYNFTR